ncbi:DNA mismatch repair protein MutL [Alteracholeplasma palmae J233]|uniref:DNA mismatch repair protein MutL n=1 Tax=Alteracholeplasma palmae (strain ATCC 49389 / J233) TaxID=1318466 RepID=U4KKT5_ALTPJ|nr:DNA mismatch repair endonuclease MutL [Alteracholeplasma palmae]CCV64297.1 DNA mismatch repair protein MutL [Alteracholeplasma palmae J233]
MPKISILDATLSNMIAAGEVVERPSSVIKELVENALDAFANQIIIEVQNMGLHTIKVTDNGIGMSKEDAKLAFLRHATSKIKNKNDLSMIKTLGFRGEALPSIASVAKVKLETKTEDSEGYFVVFNGNELITEGTAVINQGTAVTVNDLFYNTPARFKYLKSEIAEKNAIIELFDKLALSYPSVQFILKIDDKEVKRTIGNGHVLTTMETIYGNQVTKNNFTFELEYQKINVKGYLMNPYNSRSRKKDINLFINQRYVKNYALTQAVVDGYHSFMMVNKYPIASIYITIDPSLVDVNVHPQKTEVKLINEQLLKFQIEQKIKETLISKPVELKEIKRDKEEVFSYKKENLFTEKVVEHPQYIKEESTFFFKPKEEVKKEEPFFSKKETLSNHPEVEIQEEAIKRTKLPDFDYIGTFSGTYLMFQNQDGLYLMDQHAAAERIRYEKYYKKLSEPRKEVKQLLLARPVLLPENDLAKIELYEKQLSEYGFLFSNQKIIGLPIWLDEDAIEETLETLLTMLSEDGKIEIIKLRDQLAKDMSCKGAIKANHQLSIHEINEIMKNLKECDNPYTCPHGRPVFIHFTHYEIEKMFKRIV